MGFRLINSELNNDKLIVNVPSAGVKIHYNIIHRTSVDSITEYDEDDLPDFLTNINLKLIKVEKLDNYKNRNDLREIIKKNNIFTDDLVFDNILLGFVYSDKSDLNNHKWWLDFRDSNNNNVYNYFTDKLTINASVTTTSWHDKDPNGIWHGRFVLNKKVKILEYKTGELIIDGNKDNNIKTDILSLPKKSYKLRLRYNIRENIWFCDILDKSNNQIESIPCNNITCDAKMISEVIYSERPLVSQIINVSDILQIYILLGNLIIKGKK